MWHFKWTKVIITKQKKAYLNSSNLNLPYDDSCLFDSFLYYYTTIITVVISLLRQQTDTKRNPWVVLYTHMAQLMTHTTIVYIAAAYLKIILLILLAYCSIYLRKKLKASICYLLFHWMMVHGKGLDAKEKLKLIFLKIFDNENILTF